VTRGAAIKIIAVAAQAQDINQRGNVTLDRRAVLIRSLVDLDQGGAASELQFLLGL
jgi:hypothetical protein